MNEPNETINNALVHSTCPPCSLNEVLLFDRPVSPCCHEDFPANATIGIKHSKRTVSFQLDTKAIIRAMTVVLTVWTMIPIRTPVIP